MSHVEAYSGLRTPEGYEIKMKPMTKNKAAAEIRSKILRKMRELDSTRPTYEVCWLELRAYIKGMAKRASNKPGGLGRK